MREPEVPVAVPRAAEADGLAADELLALVARAPARHLESVLAAVEEALAAAQERGERRAAGADDLPAQRRYYLARLAARQAVARLPWRERRAARHALERCLATRMR